MPEGRRLRAAVAAGCAYEVFALASGRVPTISRLCRRHRSVEVLVLGVLIIHLHYREKAVP
jgi:hypothetical protein